MKKGRIAIDGLSAVLLQPLGPHCSGVALEGNPNGFRSAQRRRLVLPVLLPWEAAHGRRQRGDPYRL